MGRAGLHQWQAVPRARKDFDEWSAEPPGLSHTDDSVQHVRSAPRMCVPWFATKALHMAWLAAKVLPML